MEGLVTDIAETDDSTVQPGGSDTAEVLGKGVDWVVSAFLVLGGLFLALGGGFLNAAADQATIAELVAKGTI